MSLFTNKQFLVPSAFLNHIMPPVAKNLDVKKKVLITGGNAGLGKETFKQIAALGCQNVTIAARSQATAEATISECQKIFKARENNRGEEPNYKFTKLDLGDQKSTIEVAEKFAQTEDFDVIICNSGVMPGELKRTSDGFEFNYGINHLGHYSLVLTYLNAGKQPKRIIMLGSCAHLGVTKGLAFDDLSWEKRPFNVDLAYAEGKMMNILFAKSLAEKLDSTKTIVNVVHPGVCSTDLFNELPVPAAMINALFRSPKYGAQTTLFTGFSDHKEALMTGKYFENCGLSEHNLNKWAKDVQQREKLWEASVRDTKIDLKVAKDGANPGFSAE